MPVIIAILSAPQEEHGFTEDGQWRDVKYIYIFFFGCAATGEILVSGSGVEPGPSAVRAQSPNHWTTRGFPHPLLLLNNIMF